MVFVPPIIAPKEWRGAETWGEWLGIGFMFAVLVPFMALEWLSCKLGMPSVNITEDERHPLDVD